MQELAELLSKTETSGECFLLDVRLSFERQIAVIEPSIFIPLNELEFRLHDLEPLKAKKLVVYCHYGVRSAYATNALAQIGFKDVHNLEGGIDAWSCEIDVSIERY